MEQREFKCRMCGACCRIKDGIVRVSDAEISRIAAYLGMGEAEFIANETELAPDRKGLMLKSRADGACVYLDENNLCRLTDHFRLSGRTPILTPSALNWRAWDVAGRFLDRINRIDRIKKFAGE